MRKQKLSIGLALPPMSACESDEPDARTTVTCEHFHNVAVDVSEGILSDTELRDKLKEIDSSARGSEDASVRTAAPSSALYGHSGRRKRIRVRYKSDERSLRPLSLLAPLRPHSSSRRLLVNPHMLSGQT
jgi:hypothetical protein